jgi:hypothetical protein
VQIAGCPDDDTVESLRLFDKGVDVIQNPDVVAIGQPHASGGLHRDFAPRVYHRSDASITIGLADHPGHMNGTLAETDHRQSQFLHPENAV